MITKLNDYINRPLVENSMEEDNFYYYHSIPISILDDVLKEGLKGSKPTAGRLREEEKFMDDESSSDAEPNKERIYLSYDPDDIMTYVDGYVILSISEEGIKGLVEYMDFQWDGIYVTSKEKDEVVILPKYIKIYKKVDNE